MAVTTFISVFSQVPFDLLKKFLPTKLELPKRLSDQCSSKQPRPDLSFSNPSESSGSDSRLMYVDLTGDGELDLEAFGCLDQQQGKGDPLKQIRYVLSLKYISFQCGRKWKASFFLLKV